MCQVSFSDPALFKRRRETNVAAIGLSRERPGSAVIAGDGTAGAAAAAEAAGAFSRSSFSALSIRAGSLPPGAQRLMRGRDFPGNACAGFRRRDGERM